MHRRSSVARSLMMAAVVCVGACVGSPTDPSQTQSAALTSLPRQLSPAEQGVLGAANRFSFALWKTVNTNQIDSNVFMSPLSASFSLGMALNGAENQTLDEMRSALQVGNESVPDIDAGYKSLIALLTSLDPQVTMSIANSIWYRKTYSFDQTFLDNDASYFNATIKPLDFTNQQASLASINGWVNDQTHGKIPSILDEIDPDNVMFLINAIYFKGSWRDRFDPAQTQNAPFHAVSGDESAQLMHRNAKMSYTETAMYQAVDLPYGDSAFTMTVVLPKAGTSVESLAASFDATSWQAVAGSLREADVDLYLPKLTMTWKQSLIPDLQSLGMHVPFDPNAADFTGMSTTGPRLYISSVQHKTFVTIDEEGTEAAAVTSTGISTASAEVPVTMRVDHPFIFVIRERLSGTVLFMGKVVRIN
ncbi:MAG TPA: serpin family protein [Gemmatimonadaceae bacterium]|jgi:serpin B